MLLYKERELMVNVLIRTVLDVVFSPIVSMNKQL